jgi:hypothetical protein
MGVVTAGVHHARPLRGELPARFFLDRESVHIGPQRHGSGVCYLQNGDEAERAADAFDGLVAKATQFGREKAGGGSLTAAEFRVRMEMAASGTEAVSEDWGTVQSGNGHAETPVPSSDNYEATHTVPRFTCGAAQGIISTMPCSVPDARLWRPVGHVDV